MLLLDYSDTVLCNMQSGAFKGFTGFTGFGSASAGFGSGGSTNFSSASAGFNFGSGLMTNTVSNPSSSIPALTATSPSAGSTVINTASKSAGFGFGFTASKAPTDNGMTHTGISKSIEAKSSADSQSKDDVPAA